MGKVKQFASNIESVIDELPQEKRKQLLAELIPYVVFMSKYVETETDLLKHLYTNYVIPKRMKKIMKSSRKAGLALLEGAPIGFQVRHVESEAEAQEVIREMEREHQDLINSIKH